MILGLNVNTNFMAIQLYNSCWGSSLKNKKGNPVVGPEEKAMCKATFKINVKQNNCLRYFSMDQSAGSLLVDGGS